MSVTPPPPPGDFPGQPGDTPSTPPTPPPVGAPGTPPPPQGFSTISGGTSGGGSAPPPIQKKRGLPGWAMALIVIGILGFLCVGGSIMAITFLGDPVEDAIDEANEAVEEASEAFGPVDPSEYEVSFESCAADEFGLGETTGTITNRTGDAQSFSIEVQFSDSAGTVVGSGFATTPEIADGETAQFSAILAGTADAGELQCEITEVTRLG